MEKDIWSKTHLVGQAAFEDGRFDGILYPPYPATMIARIRGKQNLAVFMNPSSPAMSRPRRPGLVLEVVDPDNAIGRLGFVL